MAIAALQAHLTLSASHGHQRAALGRGHAKLIGSQALTAAQRSNINGLGCVSLS